MRSFKMQPQVKTDASCPLDSVGHHTGTEHAEDAQKSKLRPSNYLSSLFRLRFRKSEDVTG